MRHILIVLMLVFVAVMTTGVYHLTQKADIYYYQGHDRFVKAQFKESIPFYLQSLSYGPKRVQTLTELAYAYLWAGDQQRSIEVFERLLAADNGASRVKKILANAYAWKKEYRQAEALYLEVIRSDAKDRDAQKALAEIYIWDKQCDKAKEILTALLNTNPNDLKAKFLYGKALLYSGRTQEARKIFAGLLKASSDTSKEEA